MPAVPTSRVKKVIELAFEAAKAESSSQVESEHVLVGLIEEGGGLGGRVLQDLGVTVERVAYRPLRRAPRLAPLITAIGVSILIQYSAALVWGKQYIALPELLKPTSIELGGAQFTDLQVYIFLLAAAVMAGLPPRRS